VELEVFFLLPLLLVRKTTAYYFRLAAPDAVIDLGFIQYSDQRKS
jgi:hypothetical protein